jgi:hypothetical protein
LEQKTTPQVPTLRILQLEPVVRDSRGLLSILEGLKGSILARSAPGLPSVTFGSVFPDFQALVNSTGECAEKIKGMIPI